MFSFQNTANLKQIDSFRTNPIQSNLNSQRQDTLSKINPLIKTSITDNYLFSNPTNNINYIYPSSPNLFHNPLTSGLNSTKNASPMMNNTANFAGFGGLGGLNQQQRSSFQQLQNNGQNFGTFSNTQQFTTFNQQPQNNIVVDDDLLQPKKLGYYDENRSIESQFKERLDILKQAQHQINSTVQSLNHLNRLRSQEKLDSIPNCDLQENQEEFYQTQTEILKPNQPNKQIKQRTKSTEKKKCNIKSPRQKISASKVPLKSPKSNQKKSNNDKLYNDYKEKQQKLVQLNEMRIEQELQVLQSKPVISPRSKEIAEQLGKNFSQKQNEFLKQKLAREDNNHKIKINEERMQLQERPLINKQSSYMNRDIEDLFQWQQNKEARQQNFKSMVEQQKQPQNELSPRSMAQGSQKYLKNRPNMAIEERLQLKYQNSQNKVDKMRKEQINHIKEQMSPKINKSSSVQSLSPRSSKKEVFNKLYNQSINKMSSPKLVQDDLDIISVNNNLLSFKNSNSKKNTTQYSQSTKNATSKPPIFKQKPIFENEQKTALEIMNQKQVGYTSLYEKVNQVGTQFQNFAQTQQYSSSNIAQNTFQSHSQKILNFILDNDIATQKRPPLKANIQPQNLVMNNYQNFNPMTIQSLQSTINPLQDSKNQIIGPTAAINMFSPKDTFLTNTFESTHQPHNLSHQHQSDKRWKDLSVLERNEMWMNNRNRKIASARDELKDKETEGCTFEPKLYQYKPPKPNNTSQSRVVDQTNTSNHKASNETQIQNHSNLGVDQKSNSYSQIYEKRQSMRSRSCDQLSSQRMSRSLNNSRNSNKSKQGDQKSYQKDRYSLKDSNSLKNYQIMQKSNNNSKENTMDDLMIQLQGVPDENVGEPSGYFQSYKQILDQLTSNNNTIPQNLSNYSHQQAPLQSMQIEDQTDQIQITMNDQDIPNRIIRLQEYSSSDQQIMYQRSNNRSLETIQEENYPSTEQSKSNYNPRISSFKSRDSNNKIFNSEPQKQIQIQQNGHQMKRELNYVPLSQRVARYALGYQQQNDKENIDQPSCHQNYKNNQEDQNILTQQSYNTLEENLNEDQQYQKSLVLQQQEQIVQLKKQNPYKRNNDSQGVQMNTKLAEEILNIDENASQNVANAERFRNKLNKAKETLARIRESASQ